MAKFEQHLSGNFDQLLEFLDTEILSGSLTAELSEMSDCIMHNVRCAVRVYERYTFMGGNRLSLTQVLVGEGDTLFLSAITAGGSHGVMKLSQSTWGEDSFMEDYIGIFQRWEGAVYGEH